MSPGSNTTLRKSPLELISYFFPLITYKAYPPAGKEEEAPDTLLERVTSESTLLDPEKKIWEVTVTVSSNKRTKAQPRLFEYEIACTGHFRWLPQGDLDKTLETEILTNCVSVLYSSVRDCLSTITGKGPYEPVVLPTVSFSPEAAPSRKKPGKVSSK